LIRVSSVGVIINPWAGKDVRRLHAPVGHTPDSAKVGIVRRIVIAALEAGASRVVLARDTGRIAERAANAIDDAWLLDGPATGSALDTRRGATQLAEMGCSPIVVLGGDGTCRDVAIGAPDAALVAISTGTNNVYPVFVDGTSAGTAAGLVACRAIPIEAVSRRSKRLVIEIAVPGRARVRDVALVDVALVDAGSTGARAVLHPDAVRIVVATIATPASTGLSSIAGRLHPLGRHEDGAVVVRLGGHTRCVRVPIVPGALDTVAVATVEVMHDGDSTTFDGAGVLAYDGERDRIVPPDATITVTVSRTGPFVIDVGRTLQCAARRHLFDVDPSVPILEAPHGD